MDGMLIVEDAVKTFRGFRAVDGISFEVDRGSFTALLGPNGSADATTLSLLHIIMRIRLQTTDADTIRGRFCQSNAPMLPRFHI